MSNETQATQVENEENHDATSDGPAVSADGTGGRVRSSRSLPAKRHEGVNGDSIRAASADASKLGRKADGDLNRNEGEGSPKDNVSKDWLVFRMCEVHAAPRLPHVAAQDWTLVAESAEQMKFGVCKFGKMPNVGPKDRERWQRIKIGQSKPHTAPLPRRPRVPPAPRRKVARPTPKLIIPPESEEQPMMLRHASSVGGGSKRALREPIICEWCGELEPPTHPKQCKLRLVECKHCKQTMQLGSLRLHFKGCAARPIVPPKNIKGGSGFLTLHRLQSNAQQLSRQLHDILGRFVGKLPPPPEQVSLFMMDLDSKLEVFAEEINTLRTGFECLDRRDRQIVKQRLQEAQMHLYYLHSRILMAEKMLLAVESSLKVGERSRMRCGVSRLQSSGQQIHRQLDEITQAVKFEIGDPRINKRYAPATLEEQLEAMKEEATALERLQETRLAQGLAPELKALTELQGRLNFFMELLICVTEAVSKNDQVASLASLARRRPPGATNGAVEERRPLGILSEAQIELAESSPLPPDRGPAGMGLREVPLDQLRAEIAQERQRYIAFHLLRQHTEHPRTR